MTSAVSRRLRIRYRRNDACVFLLCFDLIELNGDDLRHVPLVVRKATLVSVLAKVSVPARGPAPDTKFAATINSRDNILIRSFHWNLG